MPCLRFATGLFLLSCLGHGVAQRPDTTAVYFALDASRIAPDATKKLDSLLYQGWLQPGTPVALIGYTDYLGQTAYNDSLSMRRAQAVRAYLLQSGFRSSDIRLLLARGEVARADESSREGYAPDRRVDIVVTQSPAAVRPAKPGDTARRSAFTATFEALPPRPKPAPKPVRSDSVKKPGKHPAVTRQPGTPPAQPPTPLTDLLRIDSTATVRLENLYFPMGRHTPYEESFPELNNLYQTLTDHPSLRIRVEGHVCCINGNLVPDALDEETTEYRLSINRARFITEYLIRKGIAPGRLEYAGYGKARPIVPVELTAEDGNRNRRVEIRVLGR